MLRLFFPIFFFLPILGFSQQKECVFTDWSKHFGGSNSDAAQDMQRTLDGGFIVAGSSRSLDQDLTSNYGGADYWVVKLDSLGVVEWQRNYGGSDNDFATGILPTNDGGYIVAGGTNSFDGDVNGNNGAEDAWVIKIDPVGGIIWKKTYGGTQNDRVESIRPTNDGGFILSGYSQSEDGDLTDNKGEFDYWVFKISANGTSIWQRNLGGSLSEFAFDAAETADGGYLVAGSSFSSDGDVGDNDGFYDFWLVKLTATGATEWAQNYGGSNEERAYAIAVANDGAFIGGTTVSLNGDVPGNNGGFDYWVMKINAAGDLLWSKNLGGEQEDRALGLWAKLDGGVLVTGHSNSSTLDVGGNFGSKDGWLVNLDANGQVLWEKNFGGSNDDRFAAVVELQEGGYACAGLTSSDDIDLDGNNGDQDFWVIRLRPDSLAFSLGNDTILCAGQGIILNSTIDGISYEWSDGSTLPVYLVTAPGEYWLEINKEGCKSRDTIQVEYVSAAPLSLGQDTILCQGEILYLDSQIPGATVTWKDGSTEPTLGVQSNGTYWVVVSKDGCEYRDTVVVSFTEVPFDLGDEIFLCEGETGTLKIDLPNATIEWQDGSTATEYPVTASQLIWARVTQGGCTKTDSVVAMIQLGPENPLPDYSFICENQGLWLNTYFENASYLWQDGSTAHNFKAVVPGEYGVTVTVNGCEFEDEIILRPCEDCLYVPNIFSPNGDGINDEFKGYAGCELLNFQMLVFDRWGNLVFQTKNPALGWDGENAGKKSAQGIFTYRIDFDYENDSQLYHQSRTGGLSLVR